MVREKNAYSSMVVLKRREIVMDVIMNFISGGLPMEDFTPEILIRLMAFIVIVDAIALVARAVMRVGD